MNNNLLRMIVSVFFKYTLSIILTVLTFVCPATVYSNLLVSQIKAKSPSCSSLLSPNPKYSNDQLRELIHQRLEQMPQIAALLSEEILHPDTSTAVLNIIVQALQKDYLDIRHLSAQIRQEWNISPGTLALAEFSSPSSFNSILFYIPVRPRPQTIQNENDRRSNSGSVAQNPAPARTEDRYVLLLDQNNYSLFNISSLVHELAHVRFLDFLEKNKTQLLGKLPPSRFKVDRQGVYWMEQSFFTYLNERYAHEAQIKFLAALRKSPEKTEAQQRFAQLFFQNNFEFNIGQQIRNTYVSLDGKPELSTLDRKSLSEIFRGAAANLPEATIP